MDGIFIMEAGRNRRPKSKAEVKRTIASAPEDVTIEGTSMYGSPYSGPVSTAPDGDYSCVGPDPYERRNFYLTIKKHNGEIKVT